jgi:hypothetical protein
MEIDEKTDVISEEERGFLEKELPKEEADTDELYEKKLVAYKKAKDRGYQKGAQQRIDDIVKKSRTSDEEIHQRLSTLEEENRQLKESGGRQEQEISDADIIVAGGKKWYSDNALEIMTSKGEITESAAKAYEKKRDRAMIAEEVGQSLKKEYTKAEELKARQQDKDQALEKYPFLKDHDDPRYKLANELWKEGYFANPRGMSLAAKRAEEAFKKKDTELTPEEREKRSKELGVEMPTPSPKPKPKEIELSEQEKEWAHQNWKGLSYQEAEAKALKAKKRRMGV